VPRSSSAPAAAPATSARNTDCARSCRASAASCRQRSPTGCRSGPKIPSPASCSTSSPGALPTGSTSAVSTSPPMPPAHRRWRRSTRASPS
jgi:hypothetical protein